MPAKIYKGSRLLQIAFPLGGLGAGSISINGQGGLQDFAIRNRPLLSALPDGRIRPDAAFALLRLPTIGLTKLIEGPMPPERIYDQGLKNQGYMGGGHEGLPRFRRSDFSAEFPFARVRLSDPDFPIKVALSAWSPFIPLDELESGCPCAILEYELRCADEQPLPFEFSFHLSHLAPGRDVRHHRGSLSEALPGLGVLFRNDESPDSTDYGSAALGVLAADPLIKAAWFRGGWFDAVSMLWKEVSSGEFRPHAGSAAPGALGRNGGSVLVSGVLPAGGRRNIPVVIAWHFPNAAHGFGQPVDRAGGDVHAFAEHGTSFPGYDQPQPGSGCACGAPPAEPCWHPFYATRWPDARAVLGHVVENFGALRRRTAAFSRALHSSTLPGPIIEAVSANLAILKSPTILRQSSGRLWGWEGCFADGGCCHGSCTHVWNYAQSIAQLFPALERGLREQELGDSMDARGHVAFRAALPDGPARHDFHAAADGQLGGVIKLHREWLVSGDRAWLARMYPLARRSIEWCMAVWDPRGRGAVEEPHHTTYDIEFWGPDSLSCGFYVGALAAMASMAGRLGLGQDAERYGRLAARAAEFMDEQLFNGEYYEQRIMVDGLLARPAERELLELERTDPEEAARFRSEGPKYQYGAGCLSDSVFGVRLAELCGLELPLRRERIRSTLQAIFRYNFRTSLWRHANPQRPGFALADEGGLLLCSWPRGGKPSLPFVYSDEVWTGIEYQVASHLVANGMPAEGLAIVEAARARYDGRSRNPWNEYECGNFYARAMSSWALLPAYSGFSYSAPEAALRLAPQAGQDLRLRTFFSTATGWGRLSLSGGRLELRLDEGTLRLKSVELAAGGRTLRANLELDLAAGRKTVIRLE